MVATVQPNHIHSSACGSGGPVLFPLDTLVTDDAGRAMPATCTGMLLRRVGIAEQEAIAPARKPTKT